MLFSLMNISMKRYINWKNFIFSITFIIVLQQMPIISSSLYESIRVFLYIMLGIATLFSVKPLLTSHVHVFFTVSILAIVMSTFLLIISLFSIVEVDIFELIIPLGFVLIIYNSNLSREEFEKLTMFYAILTLFMGLFSLLYYAGGFYLSPHYLVTNKNHIGPMIGIASIILLNRVICQKSSFYKLTFLTILFILSFFILIYMQNRSSIFSLSIIFIITLLKQFLVNIRKSKISISLFIVSVLLFFVIILQVPLITESIIGVTESFSLDRISSGRISVYIDSVQFFSNNVLFGNISANTVFSRIPHNYILNKWVQYGLFFSFGYLTHYFYLLYFSLKSSNKVLSEISSVIIFSLIVSLFEYTYPYGPGTSQFFLWMLFGFNLFLLDRRNKNGHAK